MKFKSYLLEQDDFDWDVTSDETGEDIAYQIGRQNLELALKKLHVSEDYRTRIIYWPDLSISIGGSISINANVNRLPFKIREVTHYMDCIDVGLRSLVNFPENVGKYLDISRNMLTSLEGCPVCGSGIDCSQNDIRSLVGVQKRVEGEFNCSTNKLNNLIGAPEYIAGDFYCSYNPLLSSLEGCPKEVGGDFFIAGGGSGRMRWSKEYIRSICNIQGEIVMVEDA